MRSSAATGPVAIVFGPEDHGLSNADLRHCQRLCAIDSHEAYASLNLAQAVLLVCWELRRAIREDPAPAQSAAAAPAGEVAALLDHLQTALLRIGYLNPQNPDHIMLALRGILGRAVLSAHDVRMLRGLARQIDWAATQAAAKPTARRSPRTGTRSRA